MTVTKGSGWYRYTDIEYQFNGEHKPESFGYIISLSGKGFGKSEFVVDAVLSKLTGYKKDVDKSSDDQHVFSDEKKEIRIFDRNGRIFILITPTTKAEKTEEVVQDVEELETQVAYFKIQDPDGYSNLRKSPGGEVIRKVYDKEIFEVINSEGSWKKVKLKDGTIGFIHESRVIKAG